MITFQQIAAVAIDALGTSRSLPQNNSMQQWMLMCYTSHQKVSAEALTGYTANWSCLWLIFSLSRCCISVRLAPAVVQILSRSPLLPWLWCWDCQWDRTVPWSSEFVLRINGVKSCPQEIRYRVLFTQWPTSMQWLTHCHHFEQQLAWWVEKRLSKTRCTTWECWPILKDAMQSMWQGTTRLTATGGLSGSNFHSSFILWRKCNSCSCLISLTAVDINHLPHQG